MMYVNVIPSLFPQDSGPNYAACAKYFHSMLVSMANQMSRPAPSAGDVGSRVTIRLHDDEPGKFRDLLGHLVDPTHIRDKRGALKGFDPSRIVVWKKLES